MDSLKSRGMVFVFSNLPKEQLILIKQNGDQFDTLGLVSSDRILIEDSSLSIEENDCFERNLPNGDHEYFKVLDRGFMKSPSPSIPDHYQVQIKRIEHPVQIDKEESKQKLILISHSTKDSNYAEVLVDFLFSLGLNEGDIVCSSYPGVGIPLGEKVYEWLVEKFQDYDLHVLYLLSHNYYNSAASLNEMGAAWALKHKWDGILLPGFDFSDIKGCIDATQICIKIDSEIEEVKHRLHELELSLVEEFGLKAPGDVRWERMRNHFIEASLQIQEESNNDYSTAKPLTASKKMTIYAYLILAFASDYDGTILVIHSMEGINIQAGKTSMQRNSTPREAALWEDAVRELLAKERICLTGKKHEIYKLTTAGYEDADLFIKQLDIDLNKSPKDILELYGE